MAMCIIKTHTIDGSAPLEFLSSVQGILGGLRHFNLILLLSTTGDH